MIFRVVEFSMQRRVALLKKKWKRGIVPGVGGRAHQVPLTSRVYGRKAGVRLDNVESSGFEAMVDGSKYARKIPVTPGLRDDGTVWSESPPQRLVKFRLVERDAGTNRIRGIHKDDVEKVISRRTRDVLAAVVVHDFETRILVEGRRPQRWQELARSLYDLFVYIDERDGSNVWMPQAFSGSASVSASHNQDPQVVAPGSSSQQRNVRHHFVVPFLVSLGALKGTVQYQGSAERHSIHYCYSLIR